MSMNKFLETAKDLVAEHTNARLEPGAPEVKPDEVYVVWSVKVLQNAKALLATHVSDGRYYEATLNGDKEEIYIDAYVKTDNYVIPVEQ